MFCASDIFVCALNDVLESGMKDPSAKMTSVKAAQKFFSEDKDRAFEAKV